MQKAGHIFGITDYLSEVWTSSGGEGAVCPHSKNVLLSESDFPLDNMIPRLASGKRSSGTVLDLESKALGLAMPVHTLVGLY